MKTAELKNVPHEIYLCVEDELQTNDFQELEHEFVTWNDRRTDKSDIKYVLAEHAAQQTAALREELRLMTEDRNRASIAWGLEYGNTLQLKDQVNQLRSELDKAREENERLKTFDLRPLTKEVLNQLGFVLNDKSPFENYNLPYYVYDSVCLFYNDSPPYNTYLIGYGEQRFGKYYATTFRWINNVHDLREIYKAIKGRELTTPTKGEEG